ncbi:MAG TPA: papain-like cysteine protease family protein [Solirubrobacteraceae bacterium]|nr:papain-like cysteine protease family protein [Solirubrobacteraceae bacterium]
MSNDLWSIRYSIIDLVGVGELIDDLMWDRLELEVPHQEQDNWCWAATSDGVAHFYDDDTGWTQCEIANSNLARTDCCGSAGAGVCNVYGFLDRALNAVGHLDHMASEAADFQTVDSEIDARRPLGVRVAWAGGGAHFVAIGGYRELPEPYVHVEDPWYGPSDVPYSTLRSGYQASGTWTHTYWTRP